MRSSLTLLWGPQKPDLGANDACVVCLVKNGAPWLNAFLEHHKRLGAAHFMFIDNGSTDDTIDLIKRADNTSIVRSTLPPDSYENHLRTFVMKNYLMNKWCLIADVDELFDYQASDRIRLPELTSYLDAHGYTCVIAQMLDMFPQGELAPLHADSAAHLTGAHNWFDLGSVTNIGYFSDKAPLGYFVIGNRLASNDITFKYGGIRASKFGTNVCLTKHPLIKISRTNEPGIHAHVSRGVACADFTALVRHYKFAGDFLKRTQSQIAERTWSHGEDNHYVSGDRLILHSASARQFEGVDQLYEAGFLVRSAMLDAFAKDRPARADSVPS